MWTLKSPSLAIKLNFIYALDLALIVNYSLHMIETIQTDIFSKWLSNLRDKQAKAKILIRLKRLSLGNAGDVKPVGQGVSEWRINFAKGYRVYYMQRGSVLIVLLCGGDKNTQQSDIAKAKQLADEWKNQESEE